MILYHDFEQKVFDWLLAKQTKDPAFTFSLRRNAAKGAQLDYFIGTEKSKYFGTTFWTIPIGYPGSSSDLIDVIFSYNNNNFKYYIEFNETKIPHDAQNQSALNLIRSIKQEIKTALGLKYETKPEHKLEIYQAKPKQQSYDALENLLTDLDQDLSIIIPIVDAGIEKEKISNPTFDAHRISMDEFKAMQENLERRKNKYAHIKNESLFQQIITAFKLQIAKGNNILKNFQIIEGNKPKDFVWIADAQKIIGDTVVHYEIIKRKEELFVELHFEGSKDKNDKFIDRLENLPPELEWFNWSKSKSIRSIGSLDINSKDLIPLLIEKLSYMEENIGNRVREIINVKDDLPFNTHPINQILFGPPGTGKTYNSINHALAIVEQKELEQLESESKENREEVLMRFKALVEQGKILFTTFHQSMCYEDFIEGIKPIEPENEGDAISYKVVDGIFKQLATHASFEYYLNEVRRDKTEKRILFDDHWNQLISDFENNTLTEAPTLSGKIMKIKSVTQQGNLIVTPEGGDIREYTVSYNRTKKLFDAFNDLKSIKNIDKEFRQVIGGSNSTAYWSILNYLKNMDIPKTSAKIPMVRTKYSYEQKRELLSKWGNFNLKDDAIKPYVIIIDEINRGNVSQIFGELITLIEKDKRLGSKEELTVTLPYSKQNGFGVPSNIYIIGTMNTADRSVEALDTALRRRFTFIEMPPKYDLVKLKREIAGYSLEIILKTLNNRIEKLLDKDHLIGHSYFLEVDNAERLRQVFQQNIIPLLQEYFYGDVAKIGLVLGEAFFKKETKQDDIKFATFKHDAIDDLRSRPVYHLKQLWVEGEFEKAIQELVAPN